MKRIYYTDPVCLAFSSTVTTSVPAGDRWHVVLAETAFYPTSGGQPFDTGRLGAGAVTDVFEDDEGRVVHVVDRALDPGAVVEGVIDRGRRFDHIEQHSGQHVLSAAFSRLFGVATVSFHLGSSASTIDLAREVAAGEVAAAEEAANGVVRENRPVSIRFVSADEAAALPLRKEPVRGGDLRLIDIENWDLSACGGTHVGRTGTIGAIAVRGWERFKGGSRVEFVCGGRAVGTQRALRDVTTAAARLLSCLPAELPAAIERLQQESRDTRRALKHLQGDLATYRAVELGGRAEAVGGLQAVLHAIPSADAGALKTIAAAIVAAPGRLAVLISDERPCLAVVATSSDVARDAAALLKALTGRFGGRGGGKPDLAQGGGLDAPPEDVLAAARAWILQPS